MRHAKDQNLSQRLGCHREPDCGNDTIFEACLCQVLRSDNAAARLCNHQPTLQPNLRLVKGAYLEPADVAYPRKADVDAAYGRLVESTLAGGS